jgi:hypothetical protein
MKVDSWYRESGPATEVQGATAINVRVGLPFSIQAANDTTTDVFVRSRPTGSIAL